MYTYSQLSSHSASKLLINHYDLTEPVSCQFYILGLHDNYLVLAGDKRFILRIYRRDWRTQEQVDFELDLLAFVGDKSIWVASPVLTKTKNLCFVIESPEGSRVAALFNYAEGYAPGNDLSIDESLHLGRTVANVHALTSSFSTPYIRPILESSYLLDESIVKIAPFVDEKSQRYLNSLQNKLHDGLPLLLKEQGAYGICIGDVNSTNFHINKQKEVTLFDFDQCGYGYRAFEIGKFMSSIYSFKNRGDLVKSFINGYQQIRQLSDEEFVSLPYFEIISVIWVMSIHVENIDRIGYKMLEPPFWQRRITLLQTLEKKLFKNN